MKLDPKFINKRGSLSTPLLIVISVICALGLPLASTYVPVAYALVALSAAFVVFASQNRLLTVLGLIAVVSTFFTEAGMALVATLLALIIGCGVFARLLERLSSPLVWLIPFASFGVAILLTKDVVLSALSLGFALPALALKISFSKKYARVGSICLVSGAFMTFVVLFCIADVYFSTGSLSLSYFETVANDYRGQLYDLLIRLETISIADGTTKPLLTSLEAKNLASEIVSLFPAFFIIACNAVAYLSQKLLYSLVRGEGEPEKFEDKMLAMVMSPFAGATFLISFLAMTLASRSIDYALIYTVSENIFYIFIPGLAVSGIMFQLAKIARFRRGAWIIVPLCLLAFVNIGLAVLLAAGLGAYYSIANPLNAFLNSKMNGQI